MKDVEKWIGQKIILAGNKNFPSNSAFDVWEKRKYMAGVKGAPCTSLLKKEARYQFEKAQEDQGDVIDWHVLGFTYDEKKRHEDFIISERENVLPILIENELTKEDCFDVLHDAGILLPYIYLLKYPNANCIGCVKATSPTYWNHVRNTFPEIFNARAEQSRALGARLVRYKGKRIFLDELPPDAKGRAMKSYDCSSFCEPEKRKK